MIILIVLTLCCVRVLAQQTELRLNPEIGPEQDMPAVELADYPFIKTGDNMITLNGADWHALREAFMQADSQIVSIVHIGDSHIQPEGNTRYVRRALQQQFGCAGRGLVSPLRMAGTNAPSDYKLSSESRYASSRLMRATHPAGMGMSGVAIAPEIPQFELTVSSRIPFDRVRIHSVGEAEVDVDDVDSGLMAGYISPTGCVTELLLTETVSDASLQLKVPKGTSITALELLQGQCGVQYSAIGNNGATYSAYSGIAGFGEAVARLHPQLIIISLGTNEGFGRVSEGGICEQIETLLGELRRYNPKAQFLLTTPQECNRRTYVYSNRRKGKRRRRVARYEVNANVARVRDIINLYAAAHHIAVWDWYDVSGGAGSASKWLAHGLMSNDRIHLTWPGYGVQGELLAQALLKEINNNSSQQNISVDDESAR